MSTKSKHREMPQSGVMRHGPRATSPIRQPPAAPAAYRPQVLPKVLQTKKPATPQPPNQTNNALVARSVYRPERMPKVSQTKITGTPRPSPLQWSRQPVRPSAYRPQTTPKVLQTKTSSNSNLGHRDQARPQSRHDVFGREKIPTSADRTSTGRLVSGRRPTAPSPKIVGVIQRNRDYIEKKGDNEMYINDSQKGL